MIATKISSGSNVRYGAVLPACAVKLQGLAGEKLFAEADLTLHPIEE
jgi:hypothetical protein